MELESKRIEVAREWGVERGQSLEEGDGVVVEDGGEETARTYKESWERCFDEFEAEIIAEFEGVPKMEEHTEELFETVDIQRLFIKTSVHMKDCCLRDLLNGCYPPKLTASFAGLGQSAPKTLRLPSLSRLRGPRPLEEFNQLSIQELDHPLEVSNVVYTDVHECHKCFLLFKKWSYLGGPNSLANCYLSGKWNVDDFYQFWINNWNGSTDPFLNKILFLNDHVGQFLTNIELKNDQQIQLLDNMLRDEIWATLDGRLANETSAQMVRQNSYWLETTQSGQAAEANFQVLEDRLDASVDLEISNSLQNASWLDDELSTQISNLQETILTSKGSKGGFLPTYEPPKSYFGWGGGRRPPSDGGGRGDGYNPESEPPNRPPLWFYLVGLSLCYAGYQWFLQGYRDRFEEELTKLEEDKKQENLLPAATEVKQKEGPSVVALWRNRGWCQGLREGGLLVGSVLGGAGIFRRAFNLIVLPRLQRLVGAYVPRFARMVLGPLVTMVGKFGLWAFSPVTNIICFFLGLDVLKRLLLIFGAPELVEPMIPLVNSIEDTVQGFFATPGGVSIAASFLERNIKVLTCSFSFGGFCNEVLILFKRDNSKDQKFWSLICLSMYGISIYIILNDHKFIGLFVQSLIQRFPSVQQLAQRPFGQVCLIFSSGVLIQSAGFPKIVTFFYAWLLYVSGLYYSILNANLPFRPKK